MGLLVGVPPRGPDRHCEGMATELEGHNCMGYLIQVQPGIHTILNVDVLVPFL